MVTLFETYEDYHIDERHFYEIEAVKNDWSLSELKRQYNSSLYERLALSTNKKKVYRLSKEGQTVETPGDAVKDPYVLEFLGLPELPSYSETELESKIIDHLQQFLWNLAQALHLSDGRSGSLLTKNILWWIWFSIIVYCRASSSST